jgi:hypothetical protein
MPSLRKIQTEDTGLRIWKSATSVTFFLKQDHQQIPPDAVCIRALEDVNVNIYVSRNPIGAFSDHRQVN